MSDTARISELIERGSTANGLKAAREEAEDAWHLYPTNGCAAHLSALLRQSGIDVGMILGAGALARTIERRGWQRVDVGDQQPGDVGVTFDNDPTPPGADHVYLVVERLGDDEMTIADNQRRTDATHSRFRERQRRQDAHGIFSPRRLSRPGSSPSEAAGGRSRSAAMGTPAEHRAALARAPKNFQCRSASATLARCRRELAPVLTLPERHLRRRGADCRPLPAGEHSPRFHVTFVPVVPFAAGVTARMARVIFVNLAAPGRGTGDAR